MDGKERLRPTQFQKPTQLLRQTQFLKLILA
jgi:hypothetical protein